VSRNKHSASAATAGNAVILSIIVQECLRNVQRGFSYFATELKKNNTSKEHGVDKFFRNPVFYPTINSVCGKIKKIN